MTRVMSRLHVPGPDHEHEAADQADRSDQGEGHRGTVAVPDRVAHGAEDHRAGESPEDQRVDAEHGEADGAHLGRGGGRQGQEDADGQGGHRRVGQELERHHHPQVGHVEGGHVEGPVGGDADAGDGQRALRGPPEEAVAEHVGHRQSEEGGQADDGVHLAALGGVEAPPPDEVEVPEQRGRRPGEAEDGHGHQLEVDRPDAEQPGHRRPQQDPRRIALLGVDVHARGLEDVARLVGPLVRLVAG